MTKIFISNIDYYAKTSDLEAFLHQHEITPAKVGIVKERR